LVTAGGAVESYFQYRYLGVSSTSKHLVQFAGPGIIMVPAYDGNTCPVSKQAINNHIAKRDMCQITALCLINQTQSLQNSIAIDPGADIEILSKQVLDLSRKLKANKMQATRSLCGKALSMS
jgi:hypothetical protein